MFRAFRLHSCSRNDPLTIVRSRCSHTNIDRQPNMALADRGRRNGWQRQATGLVTSHAALGTTAVAVPDRGGPLLKGPKHSAQVLEADATSERWESALDR